MSDETPVNGAPPAAPPPTVPAAGEALVASLLQQVGAHLARNPAPQDVPKIIAGALRAAIQGERVRCVLLLKSASAQADADSHRAAKGGRGQLAQRLALTHQVATGLAEAVARDPDAGVCPTCRGTKRVASSVVLAGGQRAAMPCPACAVPAEEGSVEQP